MFNRYMKVFIPFLPLLFMAAMFYSGSAEAFFVPVKESTELSVMLMNPYENFKDFKKDRLLVSGTLVKRALGKKTGVHVAYTVAKDHSAAASYLSYELNPHYSLIVSAEMDTKLALKPAAAVNANYGSVNLFVEATKENMLGGVKVYLGKMTHVGALVKFSYDLVKTKTYIGFMVGIQLSSKGTENLKKL